MTSQMPSHLSDTDLAPVFSKLAEYARSQGLNPETDPIAVPANLGVTDTDLVNLEAFGAATVHREQGALPLVTLAWEDATYRQRIVEAPDTKAAAKPHSFAKADDQG